MKTSERERKLSFITLAVIVFFLFYQFLLIPKWAEIGRLEEQAAKAHMDLTIVEGKIKILEAIEKTLPATKGDPGKEWKLRALCTLLGAVSKSRLSLTSIKPEEIEGQGLVIDLSCDGAYNHLYSFIKILRDLSMVFVIDSLNVTGGGSKKPVLSMKMGLNLSF
jgi:hypothetical protein